MGHRSGRSWALLWLSTALVTAACGKETGIVLEITMSTELRNSLEQNDQDFNTLRVWVGHATEDPSFFTAAGDAYFTVGKTRAELDQPFRYLLEPSSEDLAAIGNMVFAAAVGDESTDVRLPFRLAGFAVADEPMDFHEGEIRVVELSLVPPDGATGTIDDACIVWGMDTQQPSRIAPDDDLDCDGAIGTADCDDMDPSRNNLDADGDGVTSCANDCMDDPDPRTPWLDPANVHPGAPDDESTVAACDHIDANCNGACQSAVLDRDGSGSTLCGPTRGEGGICDFEPADCDENFAGNQVGLAPAAEACNGRDDGCDGFLPPALPCLIPDMPGKCYFGAVGCDELRGEYLGEPGQLDCKRLPGAFSDVQAPPILCGTVPVESCLESGDPVGCPTANGLPRADCVIGLSADSVCPHGRSSLSYPGLVPPPSCAWLVVGGVQQAEWEVGFVVANATGNLMPMATISECTPHLVARSRSRAPSPRTVLLLLMSPQNPAFGARPLFVTLTPEGNGTQCDPDLTCQITAGG